MGRRDWEQKGGISIDELLSNASQILEDIQKLCFKKLWIFKKKIRERLILGTNFMNFTSSNKNDHEIHGDLLGFIGIVIQNGKKK